MRYTGVQYEKKNLMSLGICTLLYALLLAGYLGASAQAQDSWKAETLSSPGVDIGKTSSLVIDRAGNLHLAYYDATHKAILYAFRPKGSSKWFQIAVEPKNADPYLSLAVDADSHPHLAYTLFKEKEGGLRYATWDGKLWHKQLIDQDTISFSNSIQVDAKGNPRISYFDYKHDNDYLRRLKYAYFDGKTWFIQTVDSRPGTGKFNSLALDAGGNPHIAYLEGSVGDLLYARWDGSKWQIGSADIHGRLEETNIHKQSVSYAGLGNCIALDSLGNPHIAYFEKEKEVLKYASLEDGKWKTEVAADLSQVKDISRASLRIDHHNRPHIAYYDPGVGLLKYATRDDKGWHTEIVDQHNDVGAAPSLALDENDDPYVSYYDGESHSLRISHLVRGTPSIAAEKK